MCGMPATSTLLVMVITSSSARTATRGAHLFYFHCSRCFVNAVLAVSASQKDRYDQIAYPTGWAVDGVYVVSFTTKHLVYLPEGEAYDLLRGYSQMRFFGSRRPSSQRNRPMNSTPLVVATRWRSCDGLRPGWPSRMKSKKQDLHRVQDGLGAAKTEKQRSEVRKKELEDVVEFRGVRELDLACIRASIEAH